MREELQKGHVFLIVIKNKEESCFHAMRGRQDSEMIKKLDEKLEIPKTL